MYQEFFKNKRVAVTGAAGTIGGKLVRRLLQLGVAEVQALDINESGLYLQAEEYREDGRFQAVLGDVRQIESLRRGLRGVELIFHAAALKHVPLCERTPRRRYRPTYWAPRISFGSPWPAG